MERKPYTQDGFRHFVCRRCGAVRAEPIRTWKAKPQQQKNICQVCLEHKRLSAQEARERAHYAPYW